MMLVLGLAGFAFAIGVSASVVWQGEPAATGTPNVNGPIMLQTGLQSALLPFETQTDGNLLGHLPYENAPADSLQAVVADGGIKLRQAAAEQFLAMVAAAKADGITLVPVSGYRSIDDQDYLFFDVKAMQGQGTATRAEVSAPPGYSEHHTGYAVDLLDADRSDTDLDISFEATPAFRWLQQNAARFRFELSFPRNNAQNVSYEPWHWRFVGDRHSLETFYRARTQAVIPRD